jgi:hypothetical protein
LGSAAGCGWGGFEAPKPLQPAAAKATAASIAATLKREFRIPGRTATDPLQVLLLPTLQQASP